MWESPPLIPFSKNKYVSASEIDSSLTFFIVGITNDSSKTHKILSYYF